MNAYSSVWKRASMVIQELRLWAITNFKKHTKNLEMTEGENSRLELMESILKFYFYRDADIFSYYDVQIALKSYSSMPNSIEFWIIGLAAVLK